jgi:hypothetical protein
MHAMAWHDKEGGNPEVSLEIEGSKQRKSGALAKGCCCAPHHLLFQQVGRRQ